MDREAWRAVIQGVAKSWAGLSGWTELNWTLHLKQLEKEEQNTPELVEGKKEKISEQK